MKHQVLRNVGIYVALIVGLFVALVIVYVPSNGRINAHMPSTEKVWQIEGTYPVLNTRDAGSRLDSFTDRIMISETVKSHNNPVYSAMDSNGYARYWHGYLLWLRPLLMFMSYGSVRELYAVIVLLLVVLNAYMIAKRLDLFAAVAFGIAFAFQRVFAISINMQFANVFIICLVANLIVLSVDDDHYQKWHPFLFFLIIGTVTNFVDLLTAPMITLGVPLMIMIYRDFVSDKVRTFPKRLVQFLVSCLGWGIGYGVTWFLKWLFASFVTGRNVIQEALTEILFRSGGVGRGGKYPVHRIQLLKTNLRFEYTSANILILLIIALVSVAAFILFARRHHEIQIHWPTLSLFIFGAILPFIWYMVLANHSEIHAWFTYRELIISTLALLLADAAMLHSNFKGKV
ncbi:hypothetical protein [Lacticaseibacillus hegangensis]|uniref:Glycosyltransferase RgtA/B/C/D-like domain-containing protein n=1 Tax=Lacticaseibacillus hegangensis TaxID=2486010 RepID=A0ABW4CWU9_9LACO|nr:hypothetical protein [Lacticaseibacillus hegangensis]